MHSTIGIFLALALAGAASVAAPAAKPATKETAPVIAKDVYQPPKLTPKQLENYIGEKPIVTDVKQRIDLGLRIAEGHLVTVESYDESSRTFLIRINAEPDNGPNTATVLSFLRAIGNDLKAKDVEKNSDKFQNSQFQLVTELWLLADEEIAARAKRFGPLKKKKK